MCHVSCVHREGVNPSSMEGVLDLSDHISVAHFNHMYFREASEKIICYRARISMTLQVLPIVNFDKRKKAVNAQECLSLTDAHIL